MHLLPETYQVFVDYLLLMFILRYPLYIYIYIYDILDIYTKYMINGISVIEK